MKPPPPIRFTSSRPASRPPATNPASSACPRSTPLLLFTSKPNHGDHRRPDLHLSWPTPPTPRATSRCLFAGAIAAGDGRQCVDRRDYRGTPRSRSPAKALVTLVRLRYAARWAEQQWTISCIRRERGPPVFGPSAHDVGDHRRPGVASAGDGDRPRRRPVDLLGRITCRPGATSSLRTPISSPGRRRSARPALIRMSRST